MSNMKHVLGIDLGTSTICVHYMALNGSGQLTNLQFMGQNFLPSMVMIESESSLSFGHPIRNCIGTDKTPKIVYWAKRLIGHKFTDKSIQYLKDHVGFKIVPNEKNEPVIQVDERFYNPEQIAAMLLTHVKETYKGVTKHDIDECIITVPAYFNDLQRRATLLAAEIAGIKVNKLFNEPTAAALAFCQEEKADKINVLIFDFGAGTLDVSIVNIDGQNFTVKGIAGDTELGGSDIDQYIMDAALKQFIDKNKGYQDYLNENKNSPVIMRLHSILRKTCEEAKINFSSNPGSTDIIVPNFWNGIDLNYTMKKRDFIKILEQHKLFDKMIEPVKIAMDQAKIEATDIGSIILVGGTTLLPCIQDKLRDYFIDIGVEHCEDLISTMDPLTVVSKGAAYIAQMAADNKIVDTVNAGKTPPASANKGKASGIIAIYEIQPITIGIKANRGRFQPYLISGKPINQTNQLTFRLDGKSTVMLELYQGENPNCSENILIKTIEIPNIPRKAERMTIVFKSDDSGVLRVRAICSDAVDREFEVDINESLNSEAVQRWREVNEAHFKKQKQINQVNQIVEQMQSLLPKLRKQGNTKAFQKYDDEVDKFIDQFEDRKENEDINTYIDRATKLMREIQKILR